MRALAQTLYPAALKASARARPMPLEQPVIRAVGVGISSPCAGASGGAVSSVDECATQIGRAKLQGLGAITLANGR
ncbi:hypothetical protein D3C76_1666840 [compost metagenome]